MFSVFLAAAVGVVAGTKQATFGGEIIPQGGIDDIIKSSLPSDTVKDESLPSSWDWRAKGLLTTDLNQHIPVYCGSCWAHATMSTIADRMKIAKGGVGVDVIPSIQVILNCGTAGSCGGGDVHAAFRWVHMNGIPDDTCMQYEAIDAKHNNNTCTPENVCRTCGGGGCSAVTEYPVVKLGEYGRVIGDTNIQKEIMTRGPVACYINANCLMENLGTGVYPYDNCHPYYFDHAIQLNGWGEEVDATTGETVKYWIGRNSWGTYWADRGFFKVVRGIDSHGTSMSLKAVHVIASISFSSMYWTTVCHTFNMQSLS